MKVQYVILVRVLKGHNASFCSGATQKQLLFSLEEKSYLGLDESIYPFKKRKTFNSYQPPLIGKGEAPATGLTSSIQLGLKKSPKNRILTFCSRFGAYWPIPTSANCLRNI